MATERETPKPAVSDELKTFGGDYHRLESTFRPSAKMPPAARAQIKGRPRDKTARKSTG